MVDGSEMYEVRARETVPQLFSGEQPLPSQSHFPF
jgi:hypothetical protein